MMVSGHYVMVVEDDSSLRESLVEALSDEGYDTVEAANGQEALELLEAGKTPCLILLDLMMPVMNGWTFLSQLRKDARFADLRVCIVSAVPANQVPTEAVCAFPKPVDLSALLGVVDTYC
jgi:CheY-like chemotaxis protein